MQVDEHLEALGFHFCPALETDRQDFIRVKMSCYRAYVEQYYGAWDEADQIRRNGALFAESMQETLYKVSLHAQTVGFWGYRIEKDAVRAFHMQLLPQARGQGVGSCILNHMISLCARERKPICLKVFRTNPARRLYKRFGFRIVSENDSHFFMQLDVQAALRWDSPALVREQIGPALIAYSAPETRRYYASAPHSITCGCTGCRNYLQALPHLPPDVRAFLDRFGLDPAQPAEISALCTRQDGRVSYDGFWHICGRILQGNGASLSGSTPFFGFFTQDHALVRDGFPRPVLQLHLNFDLPWVLQEENTYEKE